MAKVVGVFNTSHSPFCYMNGNLWNEVRDRRSLRHDVPRDDLETNLLKAERIASAFSTLREKVAESEPEVVIIFGDDQLECFDFRNFPAFAVYVGEEFEGQLASRGSYNADPVQRVTLKGHPELGAALMTGLMRNGFDPAFSMEMPKPEHGVGHAILRPTESLTDLKTPILPVLLNCYYAPQPSGKRCYDFGRAVRNAIDEYPGDLRVAVVGSGGLWHTPGAQDAYLDEEFDQVMLGYLERGSPRAMAEHFDAYEIAPDDASQDIRERGRSATGMLSLGGPQGGTRETCNWIAAAGVVDGKPFKVVDYVPVYASPIGAGFAYCENP